MLREGQLDEREIEIEVRALPIGVEIMAPAGMEDLTQQLQSMFSNLGGTRTRTRKVKVREAFKLLTDEEAAKMINEEELKLRALANAEQNGIVFIDEIDKIARRQETHGADVSREGVQRDLLPLVEGSTVSTKYGMVKTDHILFIASGAFHMSKPSDLIPGAAGPLSDPRRARRAQGRGLRSHPHRAGRVAVHAVPRAARNRRRDSSSSPRAACGASPKSPTRSTSAPRTSARAACTRCSSACSKRCRSKRPTATASSVTVDADVRRRAPRRAGEGRGSDALHPVGYGTGTADAELEL